MPKMHERGMHRRDMPFNCTKILILSFFLLLRLRFHHNKQAVYANTHNVTGEL